MMEEQEISQKEKLLRIIKHVGKRKAKPVKIPQLKVGDVDSIDVPNMVIAKTYKGTPSLKVRGVMRQIIRDYDKD